MFAFVQGLAVSEQEPVVFVQGHTFDLRQLFQLNSRDYSHLNN